MAELTVDILQAVVAACQTGAAEASEALTRCLGSSITLSVGVQEKLDLHALPEGFDGPGLAVILTVGESAALFLIPESSGLLPPWYEEPDATGQSKLTTLAQELGMLLLPESHMPDDFQANRVKVLAGAIARGGAAEGSPAVRLELSAGAGPATAALLVWPATRPKSVLGAPKKADEPAATPPPPAAKPAAPPTAAKPAAPPTAAKPAAPPTAAKPAAKPKAPPPKPRAQSPRDLPAYSQSLLHIEVPVVVTLARKRELLNKILQLSPGAIIDFDKSCEEMLDLDVGDQTVACGEAVKVGDKFGLRITSIVLPEERFHRVEPAKAK